MGRLQVMKFGGTSVGDASCIARAAEIVTQAGRKNGCVVVVSAMSGVTNRLIEAAKNAQTGKAAEATAILEALKNQHETALVRLIHSEEGRGRIRSKMEEVLAEGRRLCEGTALLRAADAARARRDFQLGRAAFRASDRGGDP